MTDNLETPTATIRRRAQCYELVTIRERLDRFISNMLTAEELQRLELDGKEFLQEKMPPLHPVA